MCANRHIKINFPHPPKLLLQKIFLKINLRKFQQKCPTPEKIVISNPESELEDYLFKLHKALDEAWRPNLVTRLPVTGEKQ